MSLLRSLLVLTVSTLALAACGSIREDLGLGRSPPDEFAVLEHPPLSMPPDFGLRPPTPGAPRPQEIDPSAHANATLFGSSESAAKAGKLSATEQALLAQSGADKAAPDIRSTINNESATAVDATPHMLDKLLWWKKDEQKSGTVVDAEAEEARIKAAKEKGDSLNKTATPTIEKEKSGWLGL